VPDGNGGLRALWQMANPNGDIFIGSLAPNSTGTPFRDPEAEAVLRAPAKFLPGGSGCSQLAGAYETTTTTGLFRYKVWQLNGDGPQKPIFSSGADLNPVFGDLNDRFPGFRRIGDYTSVDCSGRTGWAAWTDLRNGKPEIWGAVIPIP
jgi:hypothetical protein